jgi:hypothetical protein
LGETVPFSTAFERPLSIFFMLNLFFVASVDSRAGNRRGKEGTKLTPLASHRNAVKNLDRNIFGWKPDHNIFVSFFLFKFPPNEKCVVRAKNAVGEGGLRGRPKSFASIGA